MPKPGEYEVEGYNERTEYDAPYHPSANFDPDVKFAHAGDTEAAEVDAQEEHKRIKDRESRRKKVLEERAEGEAHLHGDAVDAQISRRRAAKKQATKSVSGSSSSSGVSGPAKKAASGPAKKTASSGAKS